MAEYLTNNLSKEYADEWNKNGDGEVMLSHSDILLLFFIYQYIFPIAWRYSDIKLFCIFSHMSFGFSA